MAHFEQISRRAEASRGCFSAACVAVARGLGLDDVRSVPACTGSAGAWGSSVHRAVFLRQFAAQRRPSHSAGVDRPGWRPGRNRTAEQELGKKRLAGRCGAHFGLGTGRKRPCLFLAYSVHQQPASPDSPKQLQAARKFLARKRLGSNQQVLEKPGKLK